MRSHHTQLSIFSVEADCPGFVGAQLTQLLLDLFPKLKIITTDIVEPPKLTSDARLRVVKADLGNVSEVKQLFEGEKIGGIFALQ